MNPEITAAIIGSVTTLIVTFLPLLAKYVQLKKKMKSFTSTALAVGYYYNFVKPVFEILEVTEMEIGINKPKSDEIESTRKFESDHVEIEIVIPRELSPAGIKQVQDMVYRDYRKATIHRKDKRDFTVNFYVDDYNNRLTIIDCPNPLNAVREYIENLAEFKDTFTENGGRVNGTESQAFRERQAREIQNFEDAILDFVRREGYAANKIKFKPLM